MFFKTTSETSIRKILPLRYEKKYLLLYALNSIETTNKIIVQSKIESLGDFLIEVAHVNQNVFFDRNVHVLSIGV